MRTTIGTVLVALVVLGMPLVTSAQRAKAPRGSTPPKAAVVVKTTGDQLTFEPAKVEIRRGQSVEWQNLSNQLHTVTADPAKATNKADVVLPKGAPVFDSGFMKPNENFLHRFTVPGTYRYVCTLHEAQGMIGEVVVK